MALQNAVTGNHRVGSYSLLASVCVHVTAFIFLGVIVLRHAPEPSESVSVHLIKATPQVQKLRRSVVRLPSRAFESAEVPKKWQDVTRPLLDQIHTPSQVAIEAIPVIQYEPVEMKQPAIYPRMATLEKPVAVALKVTTSKPFAQDPQESLSGIHDQLPKPLLLPNLVPWSVRNTPDSEALQDFLQIVSKRIEKSKRYPRWAMDAGLEGKAVVRFTILQDGTLGEDIYLASSSGTEILDDAAIAAIKNAAPFPALPQSLKRDLLQIELPMDFRLRGS